MNNADIPESILQRLKSKGFLDGRLMALERLLNAKKENFKQGLGIFTNLEWVDTGLEQLEEGTFNITTNFEALKLSKLGIIISDVVDVLSSSDVGIEEKKKLLEMIERIDSRNRFDFLHMTMSNITVIIMPDNLSLGKTLIVERKISGNSYHHTLIMMGVNSEATIYSRTIHEDSKHEGIDTDYDPDEISKKIIATDNLDIDMNDGSRLYLIENRQYSNRHFLHSRSKAMLGTNSGLKWLRLDNDCRLMISEQSSILKGDLSRCVMNNMMLGNDKSEYNLNNISDHQARGTYSLIQGRAVLMHGKSTMKGLIRIRENAFDANGYQRSDVLILDDDARAVSIPELEIHNDDVKCSHGSSISRLDEEKKYYMQSRGLNEDEATRIIVEGFYNSMIADVPDIIVRQDLLETLKHRMR